MPRRGCGGVGGRGSGACSKSPMSPLTSSAAHRNNRSPAHPLTRSPARPLTRPPLPSRHDMIAADSNGLSDPYCIIKVAHPHQPQPLPYPALPRSRAYLDASVPHQHARTPTPRAFT